MEGLEWTDGDLATISARRIETEKKKECLLLNLNCIQQQLGKYFIGGMKKKHSKDSIPNFISTNKSKFRSIFTHICNQFIAEESSSLNSIV